MTDQASFTLRGRNPDVLTCIANLSNDEVLQAQPIRSIATASDELKLSVPTVTASMKHLAKLGITRETTGRNYAYDKYLKILNEGTEPLN